MTNAVAERTEATTETQAATSAETKDEVTDLVTDGETAVQTETGEENKTTETTEVDPAAHEAELAAEAAKAEEVRLEELAEKKLAEKEAKAAAEKKAKDLKDKTHGQKVKSQTEVRGLLTALRDGYTITHRETGEELVINDTVFKQFSDPLDSVSLVSDQVAEERISEEFREAILSELPEKEREPFMAALYGEDKKEVPIATIVAALAEYAREANALKSKAFKSLTRPQLEELAKGGHRGLHDLRNSEYKAGQKNPDLGEKETEGKTSTGNNLTRASYTSMTPEQRQQAWRDRPAEMRALATSLRS